MRSLLVLLIISGAVLAKTLSKTNPKEVIEEKQQQPSKAPTKEELEQNQNAFYHFETSIDDQINDQSQVRTETRDGLKVVGSYSYSDGYFRRTVNYEADDKGYRVVSQEMEPLEGPQINLEGSASVRNVAHGNDLSYTIQSVPDEGDTKKIVNGKVLLVPVETA